MTRRPAHFPALLITALALVACNLPLGTSTPTVQPARSPEVTAQPSATVDLPPTGMHEPSPTPLPETGETSTPLPTSSAPPPAPLWVVNLDAEQISSLTWLPDSSAVAASTPTGVQFASREFEGDVPASFSTPHPASILKISPDGGVIAVQVNSPDAARQIMLWDLTTSEPLDEWNGRLSDAISIAFSPDRQTFATGYPDGTINMWDSETTEVVDTLTAGDGWVIGLDYSPEGDRLAAIVQAGGDRVIVLALDGSSRETFTPEGLFAGPVATPIFPAEWDYLGWVSRGTIVLVDPDNGQEFQRITHQDFIAGSAFGPRGRVIATASSEITDGVAQPIVVLWDVRTSAPLAILNDFEHPPTALAFSPDGTRLAIARSGGAIMMYGLTP